MGRFWKQRVAEPVRDLLRQGLTAEGIALALAFGVATGLFPVLGTTTVLGLATAGALRLNHPALQLANWVVYPAQIALIVPLVRLGEWLAGAPPTSFSVTQVVNRTMTDPVDAVAHYGMTGVHGILGWLAMAPVLILGLYAVLRPVLKGVQARVRPWGAGAASVGPLGSEAP
jgi:uncharacterized protein (DUF2062 family)